MTSSSGTPVPFLRRRRAEQLTVCFLSSILTTWYALDQVELPDVDFERYVADQTLKNVARKTLESAITLLKNSNETDKGLPIGKPHDIARACSCPIPNQERNIRLSRRSIPRTVIGSPAAPSRFGILNNLPFTFNVPWTPYQGVLSDGFGSGSSPAPYVVDPLTGFIVRGLQEERPINIDGYYSECVCGGPQGIELKSIALTSLPLQRSLGGNLPCRREKHFRPRYQAHVRVQGLCLCRGGRERKLGPEEPRGMRDAHLFLLNPM